MRLLLAVAVASLAMLAWFPGSAVSSTCGSGTCGGGGWPPCNDFTLGTQYSPGNGHTYVCVFGYPDYWALIH